jgi:hypothetical protein
MVEKYRVSMLKMNACNRHESAAGDEPVILEFLGDCRWPEDKFVD